MTFPGHAQPVYTVSFTPDGKGVATGGEDNRIRIWNPDNDGKAIRDIGGFGGTVFKLRYSPDGKNLLACSRRQDGPRLQAPPARQLRKLQGHNDWIYSLAISRDGKTVASGSWDGEVRLWNLADGKLIRSIIAAPGYKPAAAQTRGEVSGLRTKMYALAIVIPHVNMHSGAVQPNSSRIGSPSSTSGDDWPSGRVMYCVPSMPRL